MTKFSGIDLHSNNSVIVVSDEADRVVYQRRLPNDPVQIRAALAPYRADLVGVVIESALNKAFCPSSASEDGCCLIDRNKQRDKNEGAKKPQLPEDHPQVVAGAAQHRMHRIASPSVPFSQFRSSLPSVFMWPIAGSIALRRLIIALPARLRQTLADRDWPLGIVRASGSKSQTVSCT